MRRKSIKFVSPGRFLFDIHRCPACTSSSATHIYIYIKPRNISYYLVKYTDTNVYNREQLYTRQRGALDGRGKKNIKSLVRAEFAPPRRAHRHIIILSPEIHTKRTLQYYAAQ